MDLLSDALVVDDRALVDDPARTLCSVERARRELRVVAVDSVGTRPESLSLLPLIEPDVIVLAPELASAEPSSAAARALHVLAAQAERTGAVIVASGVDSELHRARALALGATYGVGELYPPHDLDAISDDNGGGLAAMSPTWNTPAAASDSPFDIASADQPTTVSTKKLLVHMSTQIEFQAASSGGDTMALGTFQHARQFGDATRRRWHTMAERIAYTGVCGVNMGSMTGPDITHSSIDPSDTLTDEWNVIVLGQFFCCILSARDRHVGNSEATREFDYVVSHDRGTVVRCARAVLSRFGR